MIWNRLLPTESWDEIRVTRGYTKEQLGSFVVNKYTFEAKGDKPAFAEGHSRVATNWAMMYLSTISGCPVKCSMCGTAKNFTNMLSKEQMTEQIDLMMSDMFLHEKHKTRQIKWMYMGEPMLNAREFIPALRYILEKYPEWDHVISTICPTVDFEPLFAIGREFKGRIEFTVSVHGFNDETRNDIIPYRQKHDLNGVIEIGEKWFEQTGQKASFSYNLASSSSSTFEAHELRNLFNPDKWVPCVQRTHSTDKSKIHRENNSSEALCDIADAWVDIFIGKLKLQGYKEVKGFYSNRDSLERGCGSLIEYQKFVKANTPSLSE